MSSPLQPLFGAQDHCEKIGLLEHYSWPQAFFVPLALITSVVLASLAIQGQLSGMGFGIGLLTLGTISVILTMGNTRTVPHQKIFAFVGYALMALLASLVIAGIIPAKPMAGLSLAGSLISMLCCCPCTMCAPSIKAAKGD
jgi:hypothetical protein